MDFLDILINVFVWFFIILLPLVIIGYKKGIKRSKDNQNSGCWKAIFFIALVIAIISLIGIAFVVLGIGALSGSFS
jgi:uncharacterized membrane protein YhaH (DUF805 family)